MQVQESRFEQRRGRNPGTREGDLREELGNMNSKGKVK
jgi:hypothetical protein